MASSRPTLDPRLLKCGPTGLITDEVTFDCRSERSGGLSASKMSLK